MGCTSSTEQDTTTGVSTARSHYEFPNTNSKKTVVIVGLSIAGFTVGEELWDNYNVVFVDAKDHFEYVPTNLKAAADDKWHEKIFASFADTVKGYQNKFKFVQGSLVNVAKDTNTIDVQLADGKKSILPFDILVIATGFLYDSPIKQDGVFQLVDRKKGLEKFNHEVTNAKNIAVIGGGIVGVELAGEIAYRTDAASKKINLIVRGDKLLPQVEAAAGKAAEEHLKGKNVQIQYNTTYSDKLKKDHGYDLVLQAIGQTYKADFLKKNFSSSIAKNGQIFVNDFFQISAVDPSIDGKAKAVRDNIFVFGDCCRTSINEIKNIPSIKFLGQFISASIQSFAKGAVLSKPIPKKLPVFAAISVGPSYGIFVMNTNVMAGEGNGQGKFSFTEDYIKIYNGNHEIVTGQKAYLQKTYEDLAAQL